MGKGGNSINGPEGSVPDKSLEESEGVSNISVLDLHCAAAVVGLAEIEQASRDMDDKGVNRPLREGIDIDPEMPRLCDEESEDEDPKATAKQVEAGDITSDDEVELPGIQRPKRGAGWWGRGPTLRPHRKGIVKTFVDGAGLPSPGRWSPKQRN